MTGSVIEVTTLGCLGPTRPRRARGFPATGRRDAPQPIEAPKIFYRCLTGLVFLCILKADARNAARRAALVFRFGNSVVASPGSQAAKVQKAAIGSPQSKFVRRAYLANTAAGKMDDRFRLREKERTGALFFDSRITRFLQLFRHELPLQGSALLRYPSAPFCSGRSLDRKKGAQFFSPLLEGKSTEFKINAKTTGRPRFRRDAGLRGEER